MSTSRPVAAEMSRQCTASSNVRVGRYAETRIPPPIVVISRSGSTPWSFAVTCSTSASTVAVGSAPSCSLACRPRSTMSAGSMRSRAATTQYSCAEAMSSVAEGLSR
jgi:hypothetical protein